MKLLFIIKMIRLVLGYVEFEARGGFCERFLNLCSVRGINLWEVRRIGDKLCASTGIAAYKAIRQPARRSGMRLRIVRKRGVVFFLRRNKVRVVLAALPVITLIFVTIMSGVLWEVTVQGNKTVPTQTVLTTLESMGIKPGTFKRSINISEVGEQICVIHPEFSWASLNILGTGAVLQVREAEKKPQMHNPTEPANIIAAKDGKILRIEADVGLAQITEGSAVVKGDLIISGVTVNMGGTEVLRRATGRVLAETKTCIYGNAPLNAQVLTVVRQKQYYALKLFGIEIPLGFKGDGLDYGQAEVMLQSGGSKLPLGIKRTARYETQQADITLTREQAQLTALLYAVRERREVLKEIELLTMQTNTMNSGSNVTVKIEITAVEDIAAVSPIGVEIPGFEGSQ